MDARVDQTKRPYHLNGRYGRKKTEESENLVLKPRHLDLLEILFRHRMLPSNVIHALSRREVDQRTTTDTLRPMRLPPNYLVSQPEAQNDNHFADNAYRVYELTLKGAQALLDEKRITYDQFRLWCSIRKAQRNEHYLHKLGTAYITASVELGCRDHEYRYYSSIDILLRDKCPKETRERGLPLAVMYSDAGKSHALIPDDVCGIGYGDRGLIGLLIERDRATEQHEEKVDKSSGNEKKSTRQTIKGYRDIFFRKQPEQLFGLKSAHLLYVTETLSRMHSVVEHAEEIAMNDGKGSANALLFGHVRIPKSHLQLPATSLMFSFDYFRIGGKTTNLSKI